MSSKSTGKNYMAEKLIKNYTSYLLKPTWTYEDPHRKPLGSKISDFTYHFPTNLHWQKTSPNHPESVTSRDMTIANQVCANWPKFDQMCQVLITNSVINGPIPPKRWINSHRKDLTTCANVLWRLYKYQRAFNCQIS